MVYGHQPYYLLFEIVTAASAITISKIHLCCPSQSMSTRLSLSIKPLPSCHVPLSFGADPFPSILPLPYSQTDPSQFPNSPFPIPKQPLFHVLGHPLQPSTIFSSSNSESPPSPTSSPSLRSSQAPNQLLDPYPPISHQPMLPSFPVSSFIPRPPSPLPHFSSPFLFQRSSPLSPPPFPRHLRFHTPPVSISGGTHLTRATSPARWRAKELSPTLCLGRSLSRSQLKYSMNCCLSYRYFIKWNGMQYGLMEFIRM